MGLQDEGDSDIADSKWPGYVRDAVNAIGVTFFRPTFRRKERRWTVCERSCGENVLFGIQTGQDHDGEAKISKRFFFCIHLSHVFRRLFQIFMQID